MFRNTINGLIFILLGGTVLASTLTTYVSIPTIVVSSAAIGGGMFWVIDEFVNRKDKF